MQVQVPDIADHGDSFDQEVTLSVPEPGPAELSVLTEEQRRQAQALLALEEDDALPDIVAQCEDIHAELEYVRGGLLAHPPSKLRETAIHVQHLAAAADVAARAALFAEQRSLEDAKTMYLRALAVLERLDGTIHQALAANYNNLAAVYHQSGHYDEANAAYLRSLAMKRQLLGERHPDVAMTMHNLGTLHAEKGQPDAARAWYEQALYLFEQHYGKDHLRCRRCRERLAQLDER